LPLIHAMFLLSGACCHVILFESASGLFSHMMEQRNLLGRGNSVVMAIAFHIHFFYILSGLFYSV